MFKIMRYLVIMTLSSFYLQCEVRTTAFAQDTEATQEQNQSLLIVNSRDKSDANVGKSYLARIFSGRQRSWNRGVTVQLILLPEGSPEMKWLCNQVLDIPESLLRRFIYQRVYRGTMISPIEVQSSEEALNILKKQPGAIAPLRLSKKDLNESDLAQHHLLLVKL